MPGPRRPVSYTGFNNKHNIGFETELFNDEKPEIDYKLEIAKTPARIHNEKYKKLLELNKVTDLKSGIYELYTFAKSNPHLLGESDLMGGTPPIPNKILGDFDKLIKWNKYLTIGLKNLVKEFGEDAAQYGIGKWIESWGPNIIPEYNVNNSTNYYINHRLEK